jgi:hypothetical protein
MYSLSMSRKLQLSVLNGRIVTRVSTKTKTRVNIRRYELCQGNLVPQTGALYRLARLGNISYATMLLATCSNNKNTVARPFLICHT